MSRHERHANSTLTTEQVRAIYMRILQTDEPLDDIAKTFSTTRTVVVNIGSKRGHRRETDDLPDFDWSERLRGRTC